MRLIRSTLKTFVSSALIFVAACDDQAPSNQPSELGVQKTQRNEARQDVVKTDFLKLNPLYGQIAGAIQTNRSLPGQFVIEGARFDRLAFQNQRYPQIRPVASVDQDGETSLGLSVEQVVFGNGRFRAGDVLLSAKEAVSVAQYAVDLNDQVASGIKAFLAMNRSKELISVTTDLVTKYDVFSAQATQRVLGGVGEQSESGLFELKALEIRTELARDQGDLRTARSEFVSLAGGTDIAAKPVAMRFSGQSAAPPQILLAQANVEEARGEVAVDRAANRPQLVLEGRAGIGTSDDSTDLRLGVRVDKPFGWGRNYEQQAKTANLNAATATFAETRRTVTDRLVQIDGEIASLRSQLPQLSNLADLSTKRIGDFEARFLGGAVGIAEAVSVLEAARKSQRALIDTRYDIFNLQLERAQIEGLFATAGVSVPQISVAQGN